MPPMPTNAGQPMGRAPTTFDKLKMGAMMGGSVGLIMGFLYGTFHIFRYGAGPNGPMRTLGQYMMGSGATFGFFMSIGSVIRTESDLPNADKAFANVYRRPIVMPRSHPIWSKRDAS